jgi:hypothetical protein
VADTNQLERCAHPSDNTAVDQTEARKSTADDPVTNRLSESLHANFFASLSPTGFVPSDQRIK